MNIAITGANGLVGVNLVKQLLNQGHKVKALIHHGADIFDHPEADVMVGDILDEKTVTRLCEGMDVVFHAAARISIGNTPYKELYRTNVEGTKRVFMAAKKQGVKTFIHFSSIHALKPPAKGEPFTEEASLAIDAPFSYEKTKALTQQWLQNQQGNGMKVVILNPTAIFGPDDFKPSLVGEFLINVMKHKLPGIVNGGYNWVDVRDVVKAAISAIEKGEDGHHYILSGTWLSLADMTLLMEKITGKKLKPFTFPMWLAKTGLPFLYLWAKLTKSQPLYTSESLKIVETGNKIITSYKAQNQLGFFPRPIEETLKDTLVWMEEYGYF